ncbi:MAG: vitamin K epoxide reductase family protein [Dehalococcoidia bacterium]
MNSNRIISIVLVLFAGAGIAISGYLTSVHYSDVPLVCNSSGVVNCEQVLTSKYAEVAGLPWSIGGIAWFAVVGAMALVTLVRRVEPSWLQPAQVGWSVLGLVTVVYLIGVEVLQLDRICLWCSAMHVMIVLTFLLHIFRQPELDDEDDGVAEAAPANGVSFAP